MIFSKILAFWDQFLKKYSKIVAVATTKYKTTGLLKVPY